MLLFRHGLSEGNVNPDLYDHIPDLHIDLTPEGEDQAIKAGDCLNTWLTSQKAKWHVLKSPALRAVKTGEKALSKIDEKHLLGISKHPFLIERQFGKFGTPLESRQDVIGRAFHILNHIQSFDNVLLFSHGMTIKCIVAAFLGKDPSYLDTELDPKNCSIRFLESGQDKGYIFDGFGPDEILTFEGF